MNPPVSHCRPSALGLLALVALVALAGACDKKPVPVQNAVDAGTAEAPASSASAPMPLGSGPMDIPGRFAYEATHRPSGVLTAERVFDAFAAAGMPLTDRKQHIGHQFDAAYCQGAKDDKQSLYFSVCEYPTEAAAIGGVKAAELFGTARRKAIRNGQTVLIELYPAPGDPAQAEKIFQALTPAKP